MDIVMHISPILWVYLSPIMNLKTVQVLLSNPHYIVGVLIERSTHKKLFSGFLSKLTKYCPCENATYAIPAATLPSIHTLLYLYTRCSVDAEEGWSLVQSFCSAHQIPPSSSFLIVCARESQWLPLLCHAQLYAITPSKVGGWGYLVSPPSIVVGRRSRTIEAGEERVCWLVY